MDETMARKRFEDRMKREDERQAKRLEAFSAQIDELRDNVVRQAMREAILHFRPIIEKKDKQIKKLKKQIKELKGK